jgi:hypothetical protein
MKKGERPVIWGDGTQTRDFIYVDDVIEIVRHDLVLHPFSLDRVGSTDDIAFIAGAVSATQGDNFFDVLSNDVSNLEDFDMLTRFWSGDVALIELLIQVDSTRYQSYKYIIENADTNEISFESDLYNANRLASGKVLCGIKLVGEYKLTLCLIDWYGGVTYIGRQETIRVVEEQFDIVLGRYASTHPQNSNADLILWTTFDTVAEGSLTRLNVVDAISTTFDINTWNPLTNVPQMQLARFYESDFDMLSTWTNLNQLNSIPLWKMRSLPLHTWGHKWSICMIDILGDGSAEQKQFSLKLQNSEQWTTWSKHYDGVQSQSAWLSEAVAELTQLSEDQNTVWSDFTFDMHWYADADDATALEARPMLRLLPKMSGYISRLFDVSINVTPNADFVDQWFKEDTISFTRVDAKLQFCIVDNESASDLVVVLGDEQFVVPGLTFSTIDDMLTAIEQLELPGCTFVKWLDTIVCYSKRDISITHVAIGGTHKNIARATDSSQIRPVQVGSDFLLGEPVFAFVDSKRRINFADCRWKLTNTLTGEIVSEQRAYSFRWILSKEGVYSLELTTTTLNGQKVTTKHGCILVN